MPGVILENLSGRKLFVLVSILLIGQFICFLIGGLIAPTPSSADTILASKCHDAGNNSDKWFYVRGKGKCNTIEDLKLKYSDTETQKHMANHIVFAFQIPTPRDNMVLDYSRWQQNLIGVLMFEVVYNPEAEMEPRTVISMDARLGYRNYGDAEDDWKYYASSFETRTLDCSIEVKKAGHHYNCSIVPLFELGSLHHDYYVINIRLPVDSDRKLNHGLGFVTDMWLVAINQNGGYTKVWMSMKVTFFPIIVAIMIWSWNRIHQLSRSPVLLEYMLLFLGCALTFLNMPLELFTLLFDLPFMLLFGDIRQGIFYAALLSFWLVFAGEHLMIQIIMLIMYEFAYKPMYGIMTISTAFASHIQDEQKNHLRMYWKHLSGVAIGCISLFIFDLCERGIQLRNPFYSIWVTDLGTHLALTFIILAGISAALYFFFLSYMIWQVFTNISVKRATLPNMSNVRRLHYEGIIYRFKFLMLATLLCAAMTVIGFILDQISEGRWKWDEDLYLEYTSAVHTGVYGMWNIYIFALIVLYSPSHKQWPSEADLASTTEIEFNEISSLTSFSRKAALD